MRIRSLKPEILEDEKTACLSHEAWRLFVSLLLAADDYGNAHAHPRRLAGLVFWGADADVEAALAELEGVSLVTRYDVRGETYLHVNGWSKHQKIDHPGKPRVPAPYGDSREDSRGSREGLAKAPESLATDQDQDQDPDQDQDRGPSPPRRGSKRGQSLVEQAADPVRVALDELAEARGAPVTLTREIARDLGRYAADHGGAALIDAARGFIADAWARERGYPLSALAKDPGRYAAKPKRGKPARASPKRGPQWSRLLDALRADLDERTLATWIEPCESDETGDRLTLIAESPLAADHLERHYLDEITDRAKQLDLPPVEIRAREEARR